MVDFDDEQLQALEDLRVALEKITGQVITTQEALEYAERFTTEASDEEKE